jgi:hypothetical protein
MNIIEFSEIINSEPKIKVLLALKDVNHISTLYMYEQ